MPILFIASDRRELEPWIAHWKQAEPLDLPVHWARKGVWQGRNVIGIANGVGTLRAASAIESAKPLGPFSALCSIGTAGALDPKLAIADIVTGTTITDGNSTWTAADPHGPTARAGLVRTNARIARTAAEKRNLSISGAIIVEMEAAAVARAAKALAVPFYCVRAVSDLADESFFIDFQRFLDSDGRFNVSRLVLCALSHPVKGFGELLRLQRRTSAAAQKLGQHLNSCSFTA